MKLKIRYENEFQTIELDEKATEEMWVTLSIENDGAVTQEANCKVYQGYLEASNVNVIDEMVEMISVTRDYESNQKIIQSIDSTLETAVNLGRL